MELKVIQPTFPEIIEFNFDDLKEEIQKKTSKYLNLVYTEDQIQDAKKDVANLRKFTKALSDERIKVKKERLKPYEEFEAKIKELDGIVNMAIQRIDGQVKGHEEQRKANREKEIDEYYIEHCPFEWVSLALIWEEKWLNASVNMKTIQAEIDARFEQIAKDLETLRNLPEFAFEAIEEYKQSLDLNKAITEGKKLVEMQKRKIEAEQKKRETVKMPDGSLYVQDEDKQGFSHVEQPQNKNWVSFSALLSTEDALALKEFFNSRNIEFEKI